MAVLALRLLLASAARTDERVLQFPSDVDVTHDSSLEITEVIISQGLVRTVAVPLPNLTTEGAALAPASRGFHTIKKLRSRSNLRRKEAANRGKTAAS